MISHIRKSQGINLFRGLFTAVTWHMKKEAYLRFKYETFFFLITCFCGGSDLEAHEEQQVGINFYVCYMGCLVFEL